MTEPVKVKYEAPRGCGYRKVGGLYLIGSPLRFACGRLPIPIKRCPTCDHGIKPSRSWTWVDASALINGSPCATKYNCGGCLLGQPATLERAGLLWIGSSYYPMPAHFTMEALEMGVCRRLPQKIKGVVLGETLVLLAHRQVFTDKDGTEMIPGIFGAFVPIGWEKVVTEETPDKEIDALRARGIEPVIVKEQQLPLP